MQLVFAAVVISFVFWGIGGNNSTETYAKVNGAPITRLDFSEAYQRAEYQAKRRAGDKGMKTEELNKLRNDVFENLIKVEALLQEAEAVGLEVSGHEVANEILKIDGFKDADGNYDKNMLENYLRRAGLTRSKFDEEIREQLLLQKLQSLVQLGAAVSAPQVEKAYVEDNTKVKVTYLRINPFAIARDMEVDEAAVSTWADEHPDLIQARYDRDFEAKYNLEHQVGLSVIRLGVNDVDGLRPADLVSRIETIKAELASGTSFSDVARRWSEDPGANRGGKQAPVDVDKLDQALQDATSELVVGQLSEAIVTDEEVRLVKLDSRQEAKVIPLEEVRDEIATQLYKEEEAPAKAAAMAEELLAQWSASGEVPGDFASGVMRQDTELIPVKTQGFAMGRPPASMMEDTADAEVGSVLDEVYEEGGTYYVGQLLQREDADMDAFGKERDAYYERALLTRRGEFYQGWEEGVLERASIQRFATF
jgi:peptidyl-prolyl cis-trans isomerase D